MGTLTKPFLGLVAAVVLASGQARAADQVVIGIGVDPTFAQFVVAEEKGFFKRNGIDAEIKTFGFGSLTLDAVLAGETDVASATELPTINARVKGKRTVAVAANYTAPDYNAVVVRDTVSSVADLIGKTVAVKKNTASEYFLSRFLEKYGMSEADVTVRNVAPSEMVPALARGDIDAFFVWEPWPSKAIEIVGDARVLARGGDDGGIYTMTNFIVFSTDLAAEADKAARILRALIEADEYITENPEEAVAISAKAFNLSEDVARTALERVKFRIELTSDILMWQREAADWLQRVGAIDGEPNWDDFVNASLLKAVAPQRAAY